MTPTSDAALTDSLAPLFAPRLSLHFRRRATSITVGRALPYSASAWCDALVLLARGELEVEELSGCRTRFPAGSVLALADQPIAALHSVGSCPALLIAVARRDQPACDP